MTAADTAVPALVRPGRTRTPTLRTLAAAMIAAGTLLVLAVAASLFVTTRMLDDAVEELVHHARGEIYLERAESAILRYQRLTNQLARGEDVEAERRALAAVIDRNLRYAREHAVGVIEQQELSELRDDVRAFLRRADAVHRGSGTGRLDAAREASGRALDGIDRLQARYPSDVLAPARRRAASVTHAATIGGSIVIGLMLLVAAVCAVAFNRMLIVPLTRAQRALADFRKTGVPAEVPVTGPAEMREVARSLNETTTALAEQRKRQLAFVGGVAHDLRSPISAVQTALGLLRWAEPQLAAGSRSARALDVIARQTELLSRMSTDLLDTTSIEAGELRVTMAVVDLRDAVREVAEFQGHTSSRHRLELHLPLAPVTVRGDALRLQQVVANLVSNAIKYSPDGGVVTVSLETDRDEAVIAVRDEGVGIAPEELGRIFEPFQRGEKLAGAVAGMGLGLSILARIVAAHGGRIEVESAPGRGSTFRVRLPRVKPS